MPRAGLSTTAVVDQAAQLVDERGPEALTLAAVARRAGVALPSLYKHVGGLDDLHARLATVATRELGVTLRRAATGRSGDDAIRDVCQAYRTYAHERPGRYAYLLRAPGADPEHAAAAAEVLDVLDGVFAGYGITDEDAVDAARYLRSTLHGYVSLEAGGGFAMSRSVDRSFDRLVAVAVLALRDWPRD